jgi:hypothetical protein
VLQHLASSRLSSPLDSTSDCLLTTYDFAVLAR